MTNDTIILRMEHRKVFTASAVFGGVLLLLVWFLLSLPKNAHAQLPGFSMLDIGQGDSFLITSKSGHHLLIDGGRDQAVLGELSKVLPPGDRTIDVMIATHPDADHIGGLDDVLKRYTVGLFLTSDVVTDTQTETSLLESVKREHIPAYYVRRGMTLSFDPDMKFTILFPDRATHNWETNTASVVGRLDIGNASALFTGDSPASIEHFLSQADPKAIDVDLLKLGHHGSKNSSSSEFLKATSPNLTLISAGTDNRYGHPATETLARLKALSIPSVSTIDHGTITFSTDGFTWTEKDGK